MNREQYEALLKEFKFGKCVLVLGPEFFMLQNKDETFVENLRDHIYNKRPKLKDKPYLSEDGFFYVNKTDMQRNTILYDIQDYFSDEAIPDYYDILTKIPFKLVINLSPDDCLSRSLTKANRQHESLFYKNGVGLMKRTYDRLTKRYSSTHVLEPYKLPTPTIENPWIFNFLGIYDDKESMIFTFDALFEFLYSVFPINNIPDKLKLEIQQTGTFLFMGFNYDKWYLKMIFFILHKICESTGAARTAMVHAKKKNSITDFFESQFNIHFYEDNTISFIRQLQNDLKKDAPQNVIEHALRSSRDPGASFPTKVGILYLSSAPNNVMPMRFDKDYTIIQNCLQKKIYREDFKLGLRSVTNKELLSAIDQDSPDILVLSLHGTEESGLLFQNDLGEEEGLSVQEFVKDIKALLANKNNDIQCIIFSSCHSLQFATAISSLIPFAIGVEGAIHEEAMTEFCEGFFESFFNSRDYHSAFLMGIRYMEKRSDFTKFSKQIKMYASKSSSSPQILQVAI